MAESFDALYLTVFLCTAVLLAGLEWFAAARGPAVRGRVVSNVGLFLLGAFFTALLIPVGIYAFALRQPPGLVSGSALPVAAQVVLTFLVLDFWRYWEHRLFHRVPLMWRLHVVHHSDTGVDVTTSQRHHPIDVLFGTLVLMAFISLLHLPASGVALYLLAATIVSLGSHANLRVPERGDRILRWLVMTPSIHAVHHSTWQPQTDSNYGAVLTLWDRLFGTYIDPTTSPVQRFGLAYFCEARDARLTRVLLQPFLRHGASSDGVPQAPGWNVRAAPTTHLPDAWRRALLFGSIGVAATSVALWDTWRDMVNVWRQNEAFQWAWLVLPLMLYMLVGHQRAKTLALTPRPDWTGLLSCGLAVVLWTASELMNINVGRQLALVLALHGVLMSSLGWRNYRKLFPTLALLFFMVPSADLLQPALRSLTVSGIELFAIVAQLPHRIDGFAVFIAERRYIVVDECSGLAYVTLAMFLAYAFGLLLYRSLWKIVALALFGAVLGIVCNALRVNAIVLIDWFTGSQMDLSAHGTVQWVGLLATVGVLLAALSRLEGDAPAPPVPAPEAAHSELARTRWFAPATAGFAVLLLATLVQSLMARSATGTTDAQVLSAMPALAGWQRVPDGAAWQVDAQAQTRSVAPSYRRGETLVQLRIIETLSADAKLPGLRSAEVRTSGWREVRAQRESVCDDAGCAAVLQATWQQERTRLRQQVYLGYGVGDSLTDSTLTVRASHAWNRLRGHGVPRRLVSLVFDGIAPPAPEVVRMMRGLQAPLEVAAASR